mgnify:CR=1 FL=1|tara:strand:+ start:1135 stop:1509 length:375 start_codon:yes stop_codon:yes gene_type:complete
MGFFGKKNNSHNRQKVGKKDDGFFASLGKKASGAWDEIDKALPDAKSVVDTIGDVSGAVSSAAMTGAGIAAATGIGNAGLSEGLLALGVAAGGINKGANAISGGIGKAEAVSGAARSGIERVRK